MSSLPFSTSPRTPNLRKQAKPDLMELEDISRKKLVSGKFIQVSLTVIFLITKHDYQA